MPDFLQAIGHDVLQEPAEKLHAVEVGGAGRALPTFREVKGTVRSGRLTRRWGESAPLKTEGAREVTAEWPWGCA